MKNQKVYQNAKLLGIRQVNKILLLLNKMMMMKQDKFVFQVEWMNF